MTMWSNEWMILYALTILIGNIAVIAIANHVNRRSSERRQANNTEQQQAISHETRHHTS
ncbi:MAG: hypothetical protein OXI30_11050 [Chloroflexota bacterium]|nr:hypothetical protein [Chloroflexota bacterium]